MKKPKFIPTDWNLKKITSYLRVSLIIASSTQFSPRVFEYWERYCKAEWNARYTIQCLALGDTTAIIRYAGTKLHVTIDSISNGNSHIITLTKAKLL